MTVSLLTIVKGRKRHLDNLLRGVARMPLLPHEIIIVHMNEGVAEDLPAVGCPLRQGVIRTEGSHLPLAEARNKAAELAKGDLLVFLDVDCIPAPDFLADMVNSVERTDALVMGTAHYLPADSAREDWTYGQLDSLAVPHPRRPPVPQGGLVSSTDYHLFWSLCFGLHKKTFARIGGFDPNFTGYGGEDTDFAFAARKADVPFYLADARCFHQHHETCSPPFNHLEDIVVNAKAFRRKWGKWPMEGWLGAFHDTGHVDWSDESLDLVRLPVASTVEAHRSTDPFA